MKATIVVALLVLAAATAVSAQSFPFTSGSLPPGSVVVSQPAYGPQQIFMYDGRNLRIVTPTNTASAFGGILMDGIPGTFGVDARGFPVQGVPGFYPPQSRPTFSQWGGPVTDIPISNFSGNNGNLFLTGQGFSPIPQGSSPVFVFGQNQGMISSSGNVFNQGGAYWASAGRR